MVAPPMTEDQFNVSVDTITSELRSCRKILGEWVKILEQKQKWKPGEPPLPNVNMAGYIAELNLVGAKCEALAVAEG